ncbi:MAG: type I secretion system permease/ATPase [Pseudomonadales bacterium]|jgi:ATP-binding cassette subfamily C protein EexD|nr:type I secretion system permease/ATPase [Pseudomonadales bacterium]
MSLLSRNEQGRKELLDTLSGVKKHFIYAGFFSFAANLLQLVPVLYMLQVYDRVMGSGSYSTLVGLTVLLTALLIALGAFEWVRSYVLIAASNKIDLLLRERVFNSTFKLALLSAAGKNSIQPLSDLAALRQFLTSNGSLAFFDAPWFFIYITVMYLFHPWFGHSALLSVLVMLALAYATEKSTAPKLKEANSAAGLANTQLISNMRNAEVIAALGMTDSIRGRVQQLSNKSLALQSDASQYAGGLGAISRTFRLTIQSLILGLGAYLALAQEISPGMIIAGSLLLGKALGPIDKLVGSWRGFITARDQFNRLTKLLDEVPTEPERMRLPAPQGRLTLENVFVTPPGARAPVLRGISFDLNPGDALGVIGPSASGKSTLARTILGVWPPINGKVRLDGADIQSWNRVDLGPYIGYLPQDIELFDGTISENICRFGNPDPDLIVAAAKLAGVHEMILRQSDGYDTIIGGAGGVLSGGQRQRIGLARAIYGNPRLLVLDEPNSNLDDQGEKELVASISRIKQSGCTVIIVSHRTMVLSVVDKLLLLKEGAVAGFGQRDQVLAALAAPAAEVRKSANG